MANRRRVSVTGPTVIEENVKRFADLVEDGSTQKAAAEEVGMTLAQIRASGTLSNICASAIERAKAGGLLDKKVRAELVAARTLELAMQDQDLGVATRNLKLIQNELGIGNPKLAVQINNNVIRDSKVLDALRSLQLEVDADEQE